MATPQQQIWNCGAYKAFLKKMGYLVPEVEIFQISTENDNRRNRILSWCAIGVPVRNAR